MAAPQPPTIVIDTPGALTPKASAPLPTSSAPASTPSPSRPQKPSLIKSCYLCDEQNPGDFSPTTKYLETCLLCSRFFCPIHKSESWDTVCNINHSQYYHQCLQKAREELAKEGGEAQKRHVAEMLINEGIFPSLGEREKAIFSTSPVSQAKMEELENFRSLDAALAGTSTAPKNKLVEERDIIGADIAI